MFTPEPVESGIRGAHQVPFARNAAPSQTHIDLEAEVRLLRERLAALEHAQDLSVSSVDDLTTADGSRDLPPGGISVVSGTLSTVEPSSRHSVVERASLANSLEESRERPAPAQRRGWRGGGGRRRGASRDHRLWLGLGGVVVVAASAIIAILRLEFPPHNGPVHSMAIPARIGTYVRTVDLERQADLANLRERVIKTSSGQASKVVSAIYESGNSAAGSNEQIVMFIGGHLAHADPAASITSFTHPFGGAKAINAGSLGGKAACVQDGTGDNNVAMCAWFDNDTFGEIVSPTMDATALGNVVRTFRPSVELVDTK